jgi:hypothetical protein
LDLLHNLRDLPALSNVVRRNATRTYDALKEACSVLELFQQTDRDDTPIIKRAERAFRLESKRNSRSRRNFVLTDVDLSELAAQLFDKISDANQAKDIAESLIRRIAGGL